MVKDVTGHLMKKTLRYTESGECRIQGTLDQIAPALGRLGTYLTVRGVTEIVWKDIELAVAEALNNAVIYGCKGCEEEEVTLRWTWIDDMLTITVHDPGNFMPESGEANLPEDPLTESGRGHFLMATLMDEVAHILVDGHHATELKKRLGPMSWSPHVLADTEKALDSLASELGSCYENLSAVFRFSEMLATARNFAEFSEAVLQQLNTLVKAQQSYIRLEIEDRSGLEQIISVGNAVTGLPPLLDENLPCLEMEVFKSRTGREVENSRTLGPGDPLHEVDGPISICPIFFQSNILGCLTVIRPARGEIFLAAESALVQVVADFLGIAYVAGRSHEQSKLEEVAWRELEIASSIQQSLLPSSFPVHPPYRTFGICRSAHEVGGDYFDIIPLGNRGLLLVIADVMGKGMPAALLATIFRTAVRARQDLATTPGRLLTEVNRQLASDLSNLDMFITAKLAFISFEDQRLHYADAGHCPILIRRKGETALRQVQADGFPLGVSNQFEYPVEVFQTEPGDVFIFITDGIYETLGKSGSGLDCLMQQILGMPHDDLAAFCNQVLELSASNGQNKPLLDDRTILVLEREPRKDSHGHR
jgi:anti-sigma regulatory factor (Ser/Thr protein kinase)